ncbi:uncharacterized protein LOC144478655 isoform X5 [Augochlora pura]
MVTVDHLINYSVEMNDSLRPFSSTFPYTDQDTYNLMSTKTYEKRSSSTKGQLKKDTWNKDDSVTGTINKQTAIHCIAAQQTIPGKDHRRIVMLATLHPYMGHRSTDANTRSGRTFKLADRMLTAHNFSKQQMASLCSSRNAFILSVNLFTSSAVMSLHVVALFRYFQEQLFVPQLIWSLMDKLTRIICSFTLLRINFFSTRINFANRNDSAWADTDSQKTIMFHNHGNLKHRITYDRY